jgi:hypothetical protein
MPEQSDNPKLKNIGVRFEVQLTDANYISYDKLLSTLLQRI